MKWEMINPHGWITLAVPGPDGKTTQWMIETSNPNGLMRLGWSKRSLKLAVRRRDHGEAFRREGRIEPRQRRDGDAGGRPQGLRRLLRHALRNAMNGRRPRIAGRCRNGSVLRAALGARVLPSARAGRAAAVGRRSSRSAGPVDEERRRIPGTVHRIARRDEFRRRWRAEGVAADAVPRLPNIRTAGGGASGPTA